MRKLITLLYISTLLFCLTSCGGNDTPEPEHIAQRTLFVYMPWSGSVIGSKTESSNSLYNYMLTNLKSIERGILQQRGLGDNRVIVFISESKTKADMFEITYQNGRCVRDTLHRYQSNTQGYESLPEITTANGLRTILNQAYDRTKSPTWQMVAGCHGSGWLQKGATPYLVSRAIGGAVELTQMDIEDFASAIKSSNQKKMDYILFDDCYMANVETVYSLKDACNYFVASTSEIMGEGMPYDQAWTSLIGTPNYQGMTTAFHNYYDGTISGGSYQLGALSAIDCSKIENLATIMKEINSKFEFDTNKKNSIQALDGYENHVFYDCADYVNNLCMDDNLLSQFRSALSQLIPYTVYTNKIFSAYLSSKTFYVDTYSGITISDLTTNSEATPTLKQTGWWYATH